jgi:hypothetical protein
MTGPGIELGLQRRAGPLLRQAASQKGGLPSCLVGWTWSRYDLIPENVLSLAYKTYFRFLRPQLAALQLEQRNSLFKM